MQWVVVLGYLLALMMSAYCMYQEHASWSSQFWISQLWISQLWISLNTALMRAAWILSLCWLIYACINGYGGENRQICCSSYLYAIGIG